VREINSTQRRRRLRLIKAEDEQADDRFRSAASVLAPASNTEAARFEVERIHRRMMMESRAETGTRIRIEFPGKETQIVTMNQPYLLVGSDPNCDLRLDHEKVHARHIYLQWVNGQIFWCDLAPREGSDPRQPTNGNWFDNEPIDIGPYRLSLEKQGLPVKLDDSPLDRSSHLADEFPQLAFQFGGVEQSENLWSVNRVLTMIGRGSQCKLRLNHTSMPYVQACLLRTRHCCWLVDIEGTGTTGVNGRAITVAPIDIGDIIQLGPFRVEVVTKSIQKQDLSRSSATKSSRNLRQANKLDVSKNVQLSEITSESSGSRNNEKPAEDSLTNKSAASENAGIAQLQREPQIHEHSVVPGHKPDINVEVDHAPRPGSNSVDVGEGKRNVAEEGLPSCETEHPPSVALESSISSFIKAHELQLSVLKSQLGRIKEVYDKPRSHSISRQARSMLDKAMRETMKTHEMMHESIKQLTQFIK
jgi:pSer/pThr/pTyr-binding forkhead associated (FHA) protein